MEPWDTWRAKAVGKNGQAKYVLHELFVGQTGPRQYKPRDFTEQMSRYAAEVSKEVQDAHVALERQAIVDDDLTFVGDTRKEQRRIMMKRAAETSRANDKRRKAIKLT